MKPNTPQRPCLACDIVAGRTIPRGGTIVETDHFHAHQDVAYPVAGLVIVASKRHFRALDEMREPEVQDLLPLMVRIRSAQRAVLASEHTYYFYNEDTGHHFHVWMVPRHPWMAAFGRSVESVRPALVHAAEHLGTPTALETVSQVAGRLREHLASA